MLKKNEKVGTEIVKIAKIRGAPPAAFCLPWCRSASFGPLLDTELSRALYGLESLFLAHGACRHVYLGTRRVSWGSLAPLRRYAGTNAAILVKKWCKKQKTKNAVLYHFFT